MSSLAHGDTYGDEKLHFYSFCFVSITVYCCCITVKLLVNAVEKRIGGSCCLMSFWWFQMWCEIEWGMPVKDSWSTHTGLPVVSNLSKRRIEKSHQENIWFYWERSLESPKETLCVCASWLSHIWLLVIPWVPARLLCPWDFTTRILEWVANSYSRGSFWPGFKPTSPTLQGDSLPPTHLGSPRKP